MCVFAIVCEREREIVTDRQTERQIDRPTDRQTNTLTYRYKGIERERERKRILGMSITLASFQLGQ